MLSQEEQFLYAAQTEDKPYIEAHLNKVCKNIQIAAFVATPSAEIAQLLLDNGVDLNARATEVIRTHAAPQTHSWGDTPTAPHAEDDYITQWTALGYACEHNYLKKAKWLMASGSDTYKTSHLVRPAHFMPFVADWLPQDFALKKGHLTVAALVGGKNTCSFTKEDLFFDAVKSGFEEETQHYLTQGISVNLANNRGETPLMVAAQYRQAAVLALLLAERADIMLRDRNGFSALLYAIQAGSTACTLRLLQAGANPNDKLANNRTALMIAAREGFLDICNLLLKNQADVAARDDNGYSAFLYAAIGGNVNILAGLLKLGAPVNDTTKNNVSALLLAVKNEQAPAVRFLLENGARVNNPDNYGQTALQTARAHDNPKIINLLRAAGAHE